jgi:hypothetical protein
MNYLIYVERSAENLQFFLWHRDYVKRFHTAGTSDLTLAPEWTKAMEDEVSVRIQKENTDKARNEVKTVSILKSTDFEKTSETAVSTIEGTGNNPFHTPPMTPGDQESMYPASNAQTYRSQASEAFTAAGARLPCRPS